MKKILITGGAGFIGSNLALKLISKGYHVRVLDNLSKQIHGETPEQNSELYLRLKGRVQFIKGDVRNRDLLREALKGMQVVIHLAAETGTGQSMYEIHRYADVNILGTANLLEIVNESQNLEKLLVASSRAVYGEGKYKCLDHGIQYPGLRNDTDLQNGIYQCLCPICRKPLIEQPTSEDTPLAPSSIYGITKLTQEQMILNVGYAQNLPAYALRFQNVYGPGQSLSNPYTGILSIFSNLILNGREINIFEDGAESRDFVYIDDIVSSLVFFVESEHAPSGAYNVGSGKQTSVVQVVQALLQQYKSTQSYKISGNYRLGDIRHNFADLQKITSLGFSPQVFFEDGLKSFCHWVIGQEIGDSRYEESLAEMRAKKLLK